MICQSVNGFQKTPAESGNSLLGIHSLREVAVESKRIGIFPVQNSCIEQTVGLVFVTREHRNIVSQVTE